MKHEEFGKVSKTLRMLSDDELCDLYWKVRKCEWDDRMGEKPKNFDKLPEYPDMRKWYQKIFRKKTKFHYIKPYLRGIQALVDREKIMDYYYLNIKKMSQAELQALKERRKQENELDERVIKVSEALISSGFIK